MANIAQPMRFVIDINAGLITQPMRAHLNYGDVNAHKIIVEIKDGREGVDLTGVHVTGAFYRPGDRARIALEGEASGSTASVTLIDHCYAVAGDFEAEMMLTANGITRTILSIAGHVKRAGSGAVVDISGTIPNIDELLAQIQATKDAAAGANAAAAGANDAAETANAAAAGANAAAETANAAAAGANAAAETANAAAAGANAAAETANAAAAGANAAAGKIDNMTVSAQAGETAGAAISEQDGAKHIDFTLPRGEQGKQGAQGIRGDSGVEVSETEPTDPNVTVWIKPDGVTDDNGYTVDTSKFAHVIMDESARAASHTLYAQDGALAVTLYGKTTETGSGDKSPDNPYTIKGVNVAQMQAGSRNILPPMESKTITNKGITFESLGDGSYRVTGTATSSGSLGLLFPEKIRIPDGTLYVHVRNNAATPVTAAFYFYDGNIKWADVILNSANRIGKVIDGVNRYVRNVQIYWAGIAEMDITIKPTLEFSDTETEFEPYNANVITPALLPDVNPLYGNGTIDDTVENRVASGCDRCVTFADATDLTLADFDATANVVFSDTTAGITVTDGVITSTLAYPCKVWYRSTAYTHDKDLRVCRTVRRWATIDSYAGESITTDYVSSTGALDEGATVVYQLATPETYYSDPLDLRKPTTLESDTVTVTGSAETAVTYPHETKHYIDSQIAAAVALTLNG